MKGEWLKICDFSLDNGAIKIEEECSECGYNRIRFKNEKQYKHCPGCGKKMITEETRNG